MTNWPTKKIGEIIELNYGKGISKHDRKADGKYPVYGANGILDHSDKYLLNSDAIIVGRKGSAGEITRVSGKFWPSDVTYYVLGNNKIDIDYLFHALKNLNLQRLAVGVKPGINRNRVYELEIPLPPIAEQRKIVVKLEKVLGKIKEAKKLREEAESAAAALLPAELHKIFSEGKKKGWEEKELEDIAEITSSKRIYKSEYVKEGIPFYRTKEISELDDGRTIRTELFITKERFDEIRKKFGAPQEGDLLLTAIGTIGKIYVVKGGDNFYFKDGNVLWLRNLEGINPMFLKMFLKQALYEMQTLSAGSAYKALPIIKLKKLKIPLPPLAEQKKIVARLDALSAKVQSLRQAQTQTASDFTALEQSLLQQAFAG